VPKLRTTFKNEYSIEEISEYMDELLIKKGTRIYEFDAPKYNLIYVPFWVFEYHLGKKTGFGYLNASNSEVVLDNVFYKETVKKEQIDLDVLLTYEEYKFYKPEIKKNLYEQELKAREFLNYKLPYLFENKDQHFITNLDLVYFPFWEVSVKIDKAYKMSLLSTINKTLSSLDVIQSDFKQVKDTSSSGLFLDLLKEIKSPTGFFKYLGNIFLYLSKILFDFFAYFFTGKYVGIKLLVLVIVIVALFIIFL